MNLTSTPGPTELSPFLATTPGQRPEPYARTRWQAGWTHESGIWIAPDGTPESAWRLDELPLPEDDGYAAWADAFWHYDHLDNTEP